MQQEFHIYVHRDSDEHTIRRKLCSQPKLRLMIFLSRHYHFVKSVIIYKSILNHFQLCLLMAKVYKKHNSFITYSSVPTLSGSRCDSTVIPSLRKDVIAIPTFVGRSNLSYSHPEFISGSPSHLLRFSFFVLLLPQNTFHIIIIDVKRWSD